VSLYLSIGEFFHSHVGLVLSIHETSNYEELSQLISMSEKQFEEDDDEMLSLSIYCRVFQALPFKVTYEDIASLAEIDTQYWGETIRIDQGTDGILFWFLLNHQPILIDEGKSSSFQSLRTFKTSISQRNLAEKNGLKLSEEQNSHIVFKSKSTIREPL